MLVLLMLFLGLSVAVPPVIPSSFNVTFTLQLPGEKIAQAAFWSYDAISKPGRQTVYHPSCPVPSVKGGCSLLFAQNNIYTVGQDSAFGKPKTCCLFFANLPITPPGLFQSWLFRTNTTIAHAFYGNIPVQQYQSPDLSRQVYVNSDNEIVRILEVTNLWDLPTSNAWNVGDQPSSNFIVPGICASIQKC